jgi:tetratricopeptide (TPR) repeat protein
MGRHRRRNRRGAPEIIESATTASAPATVVVSETLAPTYVPVPPNPWSAESDSPVLPLEGLQPWDDIRGPSIALEEPPVMKDFRAPDSDDPRQLDLAAAPAEVQAELVLESPPVAVAAPAAEAPIMHAEPVIVLEPVVDPVELRFEAGRAAAAEGRGLDARAIFRDVIAQRPAHLAARGALAQLLEKTGDTQGALVEYDRALESDPDHATLLTGRGALLGAMGRYAAAERDLKRVLRNDASHVDGLFHLGVVMTRKGLWSEAVQQLRRVVEIDPSRAQAYFHLGEALNKIDDLYGAMAAYQRAAELTPDHPRALYGLGIVYDRLGRPDDAARMYRRSREIGKR